MAAEPSLRPVGNHIVVERDAARDKTPGGIVLPDTAKDRPGRGRVLAVGPGVIPDGDSLPVPPIAVRDSCTGTLTAGVRVGDVVYFTWYGGTEVEIGGRTLVVLTASDVLAVEAAG